VSARKPSLRSGAATDSPVATIASCTGEEWSNPMAQISRDECPEDYIESEFVHWSHFPFQSLMLRSLMSCSEVLPLLATFKHLQPHDVFDLRDVFAKRKHPWTYFWLECLDNLLVTERPLYWLKLASNLWSVTVKHWQIQIFYPFPWAGENYFSLFTHSCSSLQWNTVRFVDIDQHFNHFCALVFLWSTLH